MKNRNASTANILIRLLMAVLMVASSLPLAPCWDALEFDGLEDVELSEVGEEGEESEDAEPEESEPTLTWLARAASSTGWMRSAWLARRDGLSANVVVTPTPVDRHTAAPRGPPSC